jgi:hypothetical protein
VVDGREEESRPTPDLESSIDGVRDLLDRLVENRRFSRDAVLDALLEIETYCQEWREALACDARREEAREGLDAPEDGE